MPASWELTAVARHWREVYGAELIAVGSDQLEFQIRHKPADHAAAVHAMKELFAFAPDGWRLDRAELEQAAADLQRAETWAFWWD
ncbi:MAG: DUF4253 domain-containing protein [Synechococcaceae cyanobacterium SM1_2_3]|nr:DUF4253 domain-containing protein [Synechococcaceae cyanobacterium SM1_2_3]